MYPELLDLIRSTVFHLPPLPACNCRLHLPPAFERVRIRRSRAHRIEYVSSITILTYPLCIRPLLLNTEHCLSNYPLLSPLLNWGRTPRSIAPLTC